MQIHRPKNFQPIPTKAKKVFEGKVFEVYQWEQKLFNQTTRTFESVKRPDSVNIIPITEDGKVILGKQQQPGYKPFIGVIAGMIDPGETPLEAAKRELLEESGLQAEKFILWDAIQMTSRVDWAAYTFIAKEISQVTRVKPSAGEKVKLFSVTFEKFLHCAAQDNFRDVEVSLKVFKDTSNPKKYAQMRKLFS